ncbi:unnamed protein product [Arabidopsis lyrata]|uniref:TF-B3 domain-containing protein n=1 Tax=Arabidopsis lyrata subsp. lyrata TaxID=81972 RepID=D7KVT5_ARALL|nr:hypothetical protein ARALYDRAFT_895765 [Arabidopsis lyrata subsp. lyrata]CAH8258592.1 unnamed protein product [Arabidopsis lyrata]
MSEEESRVPSKKTEVRLFGVSIPLSSASSTNSDEELKKNHCLEDPKKGFVSTTLCLYDDTWHCRNADYPNVTCAPGNEELTRKIKQYETGPWVIKKKLNIFDIRRQLYLSKADVECHILRYLSEDDQKKLVQGDGIIVHMYDHESDTSQFAQCASVEVDFENELLSKGYLPPRFCSQKRLKAGDMIGLAWDRFNYKLHFRVLSRATAKAPTEELKLFH